MCCYSPRERTRCGETQTATLSHSRSTRADQRQTLIEADLSRRQTQKVLDGPWLVLVAVHCYELRSRILRDQRARFSKARIRDVETISLSPKRL